MKRSLRLRKDVLTELTDHELEALAGAQELPTLRGCFVVRTMPLYTCLFVCTEA